MNCVILNHLLTSCLTGLHFLLTINLLILHKVQPEFVVSTVSFLSARNSLLPEHLHFVVSELEPDVPLELGEIKLFWHFLIHLTMSALQIAGSVSNFRREWLLETPTVT